MLQTLSGLLLFLLELMLTSGQTVEHNLLGFKDNSTTQLHNVLHFKNKTLFREETDHNATYTDKENFQDYKRNVQYRSCNEKLLLMRGLVCWNNTFHRWMMELAEMKWCHWGKVLRYYSVLDTCLKNASTISNCYFPGPVVQKLFVDIHKQYFSSCSSVDPIFHAPPSVVLILTLLTISLIPIAVYMIIWKSNVKN